MVVGSMGHTDRRTRPAAVVAMTVILLFADILRSVAFQVAVRERRGTRDSCFLGMASRSLETGSKPTSYIASIRYRNFAGATGKDGEELHLDLSSWCEIDGLSVPSNLVVVTGESGGGKVRPNL
jgi:hypothetical protein